MQLMRDRSEGLCLCNAVRQAHICAAGTRQHMHKSHYAHASICAMQLTSVLPHGASQCVQQRCAIVPLCEAPSRVRQHVTVTSIGSRPRLLGRAEMKVSPDTGIVPLELPAGFKRI